MATEIKITDTIRKHLEEILKNTELPQNDESRESIADTWLRKMNAFMAQASSLNFHEADSFPADGINAALFITYSGSLISVGPDRDGRRWAEYASIKQRKDVPDTLVSKETALADDIARDGYIEFTNGPVMKTSPVYRIAVCSDDIHPDEAERRVREATIYLTNAFVKINRTLYPSEEHPDQFTSKKMIRFISARHSLTQKQVRDVLEDYFTIAETGILLWERVPFGKMGRLFLKMRPAQKARVGRNPSTGEEITIPAKPEMPAPRVKFSKSFRDRVADAHVPE
jgi:nucleoid DNA-binding protein